MRPRQATLRLTSRCRAPRWVGADLVGPLDQRLRIGRLEGREDLRPLLARVVERLDAGMIG